MKISFPCTGCGRTLRARPDSVGRTRKCPVCATRVTCAGPSTARPGDDEILNAEIVEDEVMPAPRPATAGRVRARPSDPAPARAPNPYADADANDDDPYQLAGPAPAAEATKPCPMCGETIMASAVKCRFCGEVFDAKLKRAGKSKKKRKTSSGSGDSSTALRDIGIGVVCMGLGIGLTVASFVAASNDNSKGGGRFMVLYGLVIGGFAQFCRGIYGLIRPD